MKKSKKQITKRAKNIKQIRLNKEKAVFMKLGSKIKAYLFTGILVTAPVSMTFYLAYKLIFWLDKLVNRVLPPEFRPDNYLPVTVPGLGIIILIVLLILIGMFATGFLGKFFLRLGEWIVYKLPFISSVYSLFKQVFSTFLSNKNRAFNKVVMLEYPRKGLWILGLVSMDTTGEMQEKLPEPMVNVFIPTTPNPTSGFLIFVPKSEVIEMDISVEDAIKFIISGGIVNPDEMKEQK
ncbi:MAG: DUF502 domain-containing protein [Alphaproteobacteria bacterium]|nr:DUF502 domain-containing protein [Alphaproteobacteria bacterium]MBQ8678043.1 DUF502 domain-containing protein [Alphaproteobacteria bacterium]